MENKETVKEFCDNCGNDVCCCIIRNLTDLEYAAEKWVFESNGHKWSNNDNTAGDNYGSFISGAKWQKERMYSKEELEVAFFEGRENSLTFIDWFTQFKKK